MNRLSLLLRQNVLYRAPAINAINISTTNVRANVLVDDFNNAKLQKFLESLRQEFYALRVSASGTDSFLRLNQLNGIVEKLEQHRAIKSNMTCKEDLEKELDEDMRKLIEEENEVYTELLNKTQNELLEEMQILADDNRYASLIFEVKAGAGGQEAMLFAKELFDMYINYFEHNGWEYDVLDKEMTYIGGLRHAHVIVKDDGAYNLLQHEAGVHRVQRVPATEKSGRMHTSTASIAIIPRPGNVSINIAEKDLKIETKRASGAGGQHVNTTDSAVRMVHLPTGIAVECQSERSQLKNRELCIKKLYSKLLQTQLDSVLSKEQATRKAQQGTLNRNEKIRTYNFVQDRVTDHRIKNGTVHNLIELLDGGEQLDILIQRIVLQQRRAKLADMIANWEETAATA